MPPWPCGRRTVSRLAGLLLVGAAVAGTFAAAHADGLSQPIQVAESGDNEIWVAPGAIDPELEARLNEKAVVYRQMALDDIARMVGSADRMLAAMQANDAQTARQEWKTTRVYFERTQTVTYMVPDIVSVIDDWPYATEGFHAVETQLFTAGAPLPLAETQRLVRQLHVLQGILQPAPLSAHEVLVGIGTVAYQLYDSKPLQDQSSASGTSLQDMQHNVEGMIQAWDTVFADIMAEQNLAVAGRVVQHLGAVKQMLQVPTFAQLDVPRFQEEAGALTDDLSDIALGVHWRQPDFTGRD